MKDSENAFGCGPCPDCGSVERYPVARYRGMVIYCENCELEVDVKKPESGSPVPESGPPRKENGVNEYPRPLWSHDWADAVKVSQEYRDGWVREAVKNFRDKGERVSTYSTGDSVLIVSIDEDGTISFRDCRPLRSGYLYAWETLNPDMTVTETAAKIPEAAP